MSKQPPPEDFDENPIWTKEDFARARPVEEILGKDVAQAMVRKRGRPALPETEKKRHVTMRLSPDVIERLRATGRGWQARAEGLLREGLARTIGEQRAVPSVSGSYLRMGKSMARQKDTDAQRELVEPNGDKRYQRRNDDGTFGKSDDQTKSLRQDVKQHAKTPKPKNQGDKGDGPKR